MIKKLLLLCLLLPLMVTITFAVPLSVPINNFEFDHDGVDTESYNVYCNDQLVLNLPGNVTRKIPLADALSQDGDYSCHIKAVVVGGSYESVASGNVSFFIQGGQPTISVNVPVAPSNLRLTP